MKKLTQRKERITLPIFWSVAVFIFHGQNYLFHKQHHKQSKREQELRDREVCLDVGFVKHRVHLLANLGGIQDYNYYFFYIILRLYHICYIILQLKEIILFPVTTSRTMNRTNESRNCRTPCSFALSSRGNTRLIIITFIIINSLYKYIYVIQNTVDVLLKTVSYMAISNWNSGTKWKVGLNVGFIEQNTVFICIILYLPCLYRTKQNIYLGKQMQKSGCDTNLQK